MLKESFILFACKMFFLSLFQVILHIKCISFFAVMEGTLRRVVRACGWERSHRPCYKADNDDHLETVCQCFTDGCNGAAGMGAISAIAAAMVAFVTYYL